MLGGATLISFFHSASSATHVLLETFGWWFEHKLNDLPKLLQLIVPGALGLFTLFTGWTDLLGDADAAAAGGAERRQATERCEHNSAP